MLTIKGRGAPIRGVHWSYGASHMVRISMSDAIRLCDPHPVPRMGYEVQVGYREHPVWASFPARLWVQNISGDFYLASPTDSIPHWGELFGVKVEPIEVVEVTP